MDEHSEEAYCALIDYAYSELNYEVLEGTTGWLPGNIMLDEKNIGAAHLPWGPVPLRIFIHQDAPLHLKIYTLAHEIGHIISFIGLNREEQHGIVQAMYAHSHLLQLHNKVVNRAIYLMEADAWQQAYSLLDYLGIDIDYKTLDEFRDQCLMSYSRECGVEIIIPVLSDGGR